MKWGYENAKKPGGDYKKWVDAADDLRAKMRKAGIAESDIMQSTDTAIPEEIISKMVWASTFSWIENDPTGFGFLVWSADKMSYLSGGGGAAALSIKTIA